MRNSGFFAGIEVPQMDTDDSIISFFSDSIARFGREHSPDYSDLSTIIVGLWNLADGEGLFPESGSGGIEEDSIYDYRFFGVAAGVQEATLHGVARMLNLDEQGFESAFYDWCHDPSLPQHKIDTTNIDSIRKQCQAYGQELRSITSAPS